MKSRSSRNTSMANSSRKRSIKPALKKLEGASGGEFDRMYMVQIVKDHRSSGRPPTTLRRTRRKQLELAKQLVEDTK